MALRLMFQQYRAGWTGAIAGILLATYPTMAIAQVAGDGTLGTQVNGALTAPCTGFCTITNGATRGSNVFHSFRQFSLPSGDIADFQITPTIQNVIVRVTGVGQPFISNIDGTIQTSNPVNFFLLNPNGIIFGSGAALNIGGSFLATTANRIQFQDGTQFNTTDPAPLLTINVPIGLQVGPPQGSIQFQGSSLFGGVGNSLSDITLIGNAVSFNGAQIQTNGNIKIQANSLQIENGSVLTTTLLGQGQSGSIDLQVEGDLSILDSRIISQLEFGETGAGGNIQIQAGSLSIRSFTPSGGDQASITAASSGTGNAGNIRIQVKDIVSLDQSFISSNLNFNAVGQGGDITIDAGSVSLSTGSFINNNTFGTGNSGNITVLARGNVSLVNSSSLSSGVEGLSSGSFQTAIGNGGTIRVEAQSLGLTQGSQLKTSTDGQGKAGDIQVKTVNSVLINGVNQFGQSSGLFTSSEVDAGDAGGQIRVETKLLGVTQGAELNASTSSNFAGGKIFVNVDRLEVDADGRLLTNTSSTGIAGDIGITAAQSISLTNGSRLSARTSGAGTAGNITLNTPLLTISGDAQVLAETGGSGQGGSIIVNAPIAINLTRVQDFSPVLSVEASGAGKAGDIVISTSSLTLADRARITATSTATATNLEGGGSITLNASNLNLAGIVGVFAETQGESPAGTLRLNPFQNQSNLGITLTPSSRISASTSGSGKGGDLILTAPQSIAIRGPGQLAVETSSTGNAGNITINTQQLTLTDSVQLSASTSGRGKAGDINITANTLNLNQGSQISTNTASAGQAGNLSLQLQNSLTLSGTGTGLFATTAPGSVGNGGNITMGSRAVLVQDGAAIAVNSQGSGTGGNITIQSGRLELRDRGSITAETASAQGGNIALDVKDLILMRRNSLISATAGTAQAGGDGGNITIQTPFIIGVLRENSDIVANAFTGRGGNITITTNAIYGLQFQPRLTPFSDITASSQFGINGTVAINTLNVDPNRGLVALPVNLTDPSQQISQNCTPGSKTSASSFVSTGRGGIPLSPNEPLESRAVVTQWVPLPEEGGRVGEWENPSTHLTTHPSIIVEAQGWIINPDGTVELVANIASVNPANFWRLPVPCQVAPEN